MVSVEFQREVDVATGIGETRMFVKMYFDARDSGLLGALGDRRWRTLCVLATYMDENGNCFPSQARIAKDLGIHRQRVNERIQELLAFRFQNEPVVTVQKLRVQTDHGGRWSNNEYRLRPVTGFAIFDDRKELDQKPNVRKSGHRPMSGKPDTGNPDTNQNQFLNKKVVNSLPNHDQKISRKEGTRPTISDRALRAKYQFREPELARVHYLVEKQGDVLGSIDRNHAHYVNRAAEAVARGHADLLDAKLSDFKQVKVTLAVASEPAYFQAMWNEALGAQNEGRNGRGKPPRDSHRGTGFEGMGEILRKSRGHSEDDPADQASLA